MARKDALLKLHQQLQQRRRELLQSISDELTDLGKYGHRHSGGDDADVASESVDKEMISQLAQMESRELAQIERALDRLRDGNYGTCELCRKKIAVARLNALPYTGLCINCQREVERNPAYIERSDTGWQKVYDSEASAKDVRVNLSDLEYNVG